MIKQPVLMRLLLISLTAVIFACSSPKYRPKMPTFSVTYDPMLSFIKVGNELERYRGDLKQFSAEIINISNMPEKLKYKFKFYDKDGFQIAAFSRPWKPVTMAPYETTSLQTVAPNVRVVAAKLFIERQK